MPTVNICRDLNGGSLPVVIWEKMKDGRFNYFKKGRFVSDSGKKYSYLIQGREIGAHFQNIVDKPAWLVIG